MNIDQAAVLISHITNLCKRSLTLNEVQDLFVLVNGTIEEKSNVDNKYVDLTYLFKCMSAGKKIEAIKEHRILTGNFLKDSKDAVESVMGDKSAAD